MFAGIASGCGGEKHLELGEQCAIESNVMLVLAFILLTIAVLVGSALAVLHLHSEGAAIAPWPFAVLHGLLAIVGLCCLALSLRGPPRGLEQGTASFGKIATALIILAALAGIGLLAGRVLKRRIAGITVGIHATLAVAGFVILAAYVFSG